MATREGFSYKLSMKSGGAPVEDLLDDIVKPGVEKIYQVISCEDETSNLTEIRVGKKEREV